MFTYLYGHLIKIGSLEYRHCFRHHIVIVCLHKKVYCHFLVVLSSQSICCHCTEVCVVVLRRIETGSHFSDEVGVRDYNFDYQRIIICLF